VLEPLATPASSASGISPDDALSEHTFFFDFVLDLLACLLGFALNVMNDLLSFRNRIARQIEGLVLVIVDGDAELFSLSLEPLFEVAGGVCD
jgi:hypothetical protein